MATKRTRFTSLCHQAGLSFNEAIDLIEVSRSTGYRYQSGKSELKGAELKLLEEAAAYRADDAPGWFRFIDLFAGIGGLRKGFESIGGRCVFTSEWDKNSQKTYAANFPDNHPILAFTRTRSQVGLARERPGRVAVVSGALPEFCGSWI
ncbi:DNA cytosine methyltransferase [Bradyrhizobium sp. USDA 4506]